MEEFTGRAHAILAHVLGSSAHEQLRARAFVCFSVLIFLISSDLIHQSSHTKASRQDLQITRLVVKSAHVLLST